MSVLSEAAGAVAEKVAETVVDGIASKPGDGRQRPAPTALPGLYTTHALEGVVPAPGDALDLALDAFGSGRYGVSQIAVTTEGDARDVVVSLAQRLRGRRELLEPVSALALQRLFRLPLASPLVLGRADRLELTAEAKAADGAGRLRAFLTGFTGDQLDALAAAGRVSTDDRASAVLLARTVTVPAGATAHPVKFEGRGVGLRMVRLVAAADTEAADLALTLTPRTATANLVSPVSPAQLDELFRYSRIPVPPFLAGERPFTIYVDNPQGVDARLSVVVEAYAAAGPAEAQS